MGVGRAICVFLPFALTTLSLMCLLIAGLSGIGGNRQNFYAFSADLKSLSISVPDFNSLSEGLNSAAASGGANLTAAKLGLADSYSVAIWGYCSTSGENTICSKPAFNWAQSATDMTQLQDAATRNGSPITIPKYLSDSISTFSVLVRWTQIVFMIAIATTIMELLIGMFALCSRMGSCCAFINSVISTAAAVCAAGLATGLAGAPVGILKIASNNFHVSGNIGTSFLAIAWLSVAFSVASGLFWLFSVCCCKPDRYEKKYAATMAVGDMQHRQPVPAGQYQRTQEPVFPAVHTGQPSGVPGPRSSRNAPYEPFQH